MGKIIRPRDKIVQRSVGFFFRQIEFFNYCVENNIPFKPDKYARHTIDEQIKEIGEDYPEVLKYLENEE